MSETNKELKNETEPQVPAIKLTPLEILRVPFQDHHISRLPKPTKSQTEAVKNDYQKGTRCKECGAWHHPDVVHLDYVGHAALTDRLLSADIEWNWKPLALDADGLPRFDKLGGLWIELTVAGVTRKGYGIADGKSGGDAIKEIIGDALRNAGMRFGCALDLWHKGDLHAPADDGPKKGANDSNLGAKKQVEKTAIDDFTKYKMKLKTKDPKDKDKSLAELGVQKVIAIHDHLEGVNKNKKLGAIDAEFMIVSYKFLQSVGHFPPDKP